MGPCLRRDPTKVRLGENSAAQRENIMRAIILIVLLAVSGTAYAAGPYDGKWTGSMKAEGSCTTNTVVDITIVNNMISGTFNLDRPTPEGYTSGTIIPNGPITPDGIANGVVGQNTRYPIAFRFAGDTFGANLSARCGMRPITGSRVK
jgi:hypothetical protein